MDYGVLGAYFDGAVAKPSRALTSWGANKSHQHEFNGVGPLRALFGDDDIKGMRTTFAYLDDGADPIFDHGYTTWYDARRKHPTRTEYRLYYNDNAAMGMARPGDLMVLALHEAKEVVILFARAGSTAESQVRWLFALDGVGEKGLRPLLGRIRASRRSPQRILESIGIEVSMPIAAENFLDGMIEKFGESFPKGADFSAYSASTLESSIGRATPMAAWSLVTNAKRCCSASSSGISWSATRAIPGSALDVDGVLRTTMSAFQRRKSRAGTAFENQLDAIRC